MKHYTKLPYQRAGMSLFQLIDDEGDTVVAFEHFSEMLLRRELASATVKRYLEVVANFIDYLTEARVFGIPASADDLNRVVGAYLRIIGRATAIREENHPSTDPFVKWARPIADALALTTVRIADNTVAAINLFLKQSNLILRMEIEKAAAAGLQSLPVDYSAAVQVVAGHHGLSPGQRKALKQNSMLANVIRYQPDGIKRPRGLARRGVGRGDSHDVGLDYPLTGLAPLLREAASHRDRALYALLVGAGLRTSEAVNLTLDHIDYQERRVFVEDPGRDRSRQDEWSAARLRFKGRSVAEAYLFEPLKQQFFEALSHYFRDEYVPGMGHNFVFQDIRPGTQRGRPMHLLSDTARLKAFRLAVTRAGVRQPRGGRWGLHSLRHTYGVYMLNYLPVPGGYGLNLNEVQRLMGHKDPKTTAHYARQDKIVLASKLLFAEAHIFDTGTNVESLPLFVAKRLRHEADRLEVNLK